MKIFEKLFWIQFIVWYIEEYGLNSTERKKNVENGLKGNIIINDDDLHIFDVRWQSCPTKIFA